MSVNRVVDAHRPRRGQGLVLLLLCCLLVTAPAWSESQNPQQANTSVANWTKDLDKIAKSLQRENLPDDVLIDLRKRLENIRRDVRGWMADQEPALKLAQDELATLGPLPAEGQAPESPTILKERNRLNAQLAEVEGRLKAADLILNRISNHLNELSETRRSRFAEQTLMQHHSPLSAELWSQAIPQLKAAFTAGRRALSDAVSSPAFRQQLRHSAVVIGLTFFVALILAIPLARWLNRRFGRDPSIEEPGFFDIARATLTITAAHALLPTIAAALVYLVILGQDLLTSTGNEIARSILIGFLVFVWVITFFRAAVAPLQPAWRLVPVPNDFARGARGIVISLALVFAVDIVLTDLISIYGAKLEILLLRDFLTTCVVTAILLVLLLRPGIWVRSEIGPSLPRWPVLRSLVAVFLVLNLIASMIGYVSLGRFITTQFTMSAALILLILILHRMGHEVVSSMLCIDAWSGRRLRTSLRLDDNGAARLAFWLGLAYDLVVLTFGVLIGLFLWGAERADVIEWGYRILFGLQIGNLTFSLVDILIAILVFVTLVLVTRYVKRTLSEQILPQTQLDRGTQQSIATGVGYLGFIVAAVTSISALGLTMTNLAIVAGALSVGVGFGLQNVVNNFVSGLILLVERPVKVGDWVVVGDKQGYVTRIKVRATELTTFDRANVFVPNSELISNMVTNLTYADQLGRIIIPVGVAYGSDTHKVRDLLLEIADRHPAVMRDPAPAAVFRGFGDSALDFELRCFLENVEKTVGVTSDLCFAIDDAFRANGIEIPFPQRDVHIRSRNGSAEA